MILIDPLNQEVFGPALQDAINKFGQANKETAGIIAVTRKDIHELKTGKLWQRMF